MYPTKHVGNVHRRLGDDHAPVDRDEAADGVGDVGPDGLVHQESMDAHRA